jgi:hypothetical protein
MVKKIEPLSNWIPANDAASLLSEKLGFPIGSRYIRQLAKSKKQKVRTRSLGYHQLYCKEDLEQVTIKKRSTDV